MKITQRTATLEDGAILLAWRNHPSTRKFSGQPKEILSEEHFEWLTARLERVQLEPFFLFVADFEAIGMSRLDVVSRTMHKYEISILVDPNQHGKGVGTKILNMTCENFFGLYPEYAIVARIHQDNLVSQKLFTGAGFELTSSLGNFLHLEKNL
jgi:UDP-2,4-diacetamido-2,4,6-trideoxy-beta-L-altropyranose hydrolase